MDQLNSDGSRPRPTDVRRTRNNRRQPSCLSFSPNEPNCFVVGTYELEDGLGHFRFPREPIDDRRPSRTLEFGRSEDPLATNGVSPEPSPSCGPRDGANVATDTGPKDTSPTDAIQDRTGTLEVYELEGDSIHLCQVVRCTAGILDIQFSPHKPSLLACAQADGSISVHGLCSEPEIWLVSECQSWTPPPATVILALAWHPGIPDIIGVTRADGGIELLRLSHGEDIQSGLYGLSIVPEPRRHDDQVWSIVFVPGGAAGLGIPVNGHNFNLYSGGDDSMIQGLMFAQPGDQTWVGEQLDGIQRCHRAGVTTLLLLPRVLGMTHNHILLTGSYDDCVRIVDPTRGDILCERNLGGSVWRLRLMRRYADYEAAAAAAENRSGRKEFLVLACCMEEGARILRVSIVPEDHTYIIDVLQVFKRDQTLCYGGDVQPRSTEEREQNALYRIITTSFYDRKMFQWEFHDDQSNGQVPVPIIP